MKSDLIRLLYENIEVEFHGIDEYLGELKHAVKEKNVYEIV